MLVNNWIGEEGLSKWCVKKINEKSVNGYTHDALRSELGRSNTDCADCIKHGLNTAVIVDDLLAFFNLDAIKSPLAAHSENGVMPDCIVEVSDLWDHSLIFFFALWNQLDDGFAILYYNISG